MPKRTDNTRKTEIIQLRLTPETRQRCEKARLSGARKLEAKATFISYLVEIGLSKYEKAILPLELGLDETPVIAKKTKTA